MKRLTFALIAMACTEKPAADTSDTADSGQEDTSNTAPSWTNSCTDMPDTNHEILFAGPAYQDALMMSPELTIADQSAWDSFTSALMFQNMNQSLTRTEIDWANEQVGVLSVHVGSTCGLTVLEADSCTLGAQGHLYMAVEDSSGGCDNVCDMEGQTIMIVALPQGNVSFNSEIVPGCPE